MDGRCGWWLHYGWWSPVCPISGSGLRRKFPDQFHPGRRLASPFHSPRDSRTSTNCPGHPLPPFPSSFHGSLPLFPKAQGDPGQTTTNSSANPPGRISLIHPRRHFLRVSASALHMSQSGRRREPEGGRDTQEVQIQVDGL